MAKYVGALPLRATKPERVEDIKGLFDTYLSDIFTYAGNDKYTLYGNTRKSQIVALTASVVIYLRKLDDSGNASSDYIPAGNSTDPLDYLIIKNASSGVLLFNNNVAMIWTKAGDVELCSWKVDIYPIAGSDVKLFPVSAISSSAWAKYTIPLSDGRLIFLPAFWVTDQNNTYYPAALTDIYVVHHGIPVGTAFYVDEREFIALSANLAIEHIV